MHRFDFVVLVDLVRGRRATMVRPLFFDGHVAPVGVREAMDADGRARNLHQSNNLCGNCTTNTGCETGLWHRGTQLGIDGYYGQYSYDTLVNSSYHILTTDGIQGRDVLSAQ